MDIKIIPAYENTQEVETLFSEYTDMLIASDRSFQKYLDIQHYDEEIKNLEVKYGTPFGRLYLAYCDKEPAGCIGLRKIDEQNCEMLCQTKVQGQESRGSISPENYRGRKGNRIFLYGVGYPAFFGECD